MSTMTAETTYVAAWLKWTLLFALFGFGFGMGLGALGWRDAAGHRVFNPLLVLLLGAALSVLFGAIASLSAAISNAVMAAVLRGRPRPRNFIDNMRLVPRLVISWIVAGAAFGLLTWATTVNR